MLRCSYVMLEHTLSLMDSSALLHPSIDAVRAWIGAHPQATGAELAAAGLVVPHWPAPWGLGADPALQLAIDHELATAQIHRPINPIGMGWAGPTLLSAGTSEQCERWLPELLSGEAFWCQLFSEASAGSDLAALATTAVRDGDEWVVNGSKIWTSYGHIAKWGILLARTNAEVDPHQGISYFICPMDAPGVEIHPLVDMRGEHAFNQVYFTDVRIPHENVVGAVNDGWRLAKVTLSNERVSLSGEGLLWGNGPTLSDVVIFVKSLDQPLSPRQRSKLVSLWIRDQTLSALKNRLVATVLAGQTPGPEASVRKALADDLGQDAMNFIIDVLGMGGQAFGPNDMGALWEKGFLFSPALTIGGGTSIVQRSIIAERVLGLPREPVVK